jgi:hypothetical protein
MNNRQTGGIALLVYGVATPLAFMNNAPGGDYSDPNITQFIAPGRMWTAFGLAYLGILGALALLVFGQRMRDEVGSARGSFSGLAVAATATSLVGWFLTGGVAVAMAEGGPAVRGVVPHPVIYTLTEVGNLLAVCAPALCVGVAALLLAARSALPRWLRTFSVVAGVCGVLAPFYFTYMLFVLWTVVAGVTLVVAGRRAPIPAPAPAAPSLA